MNTHISTQGLYCKDNYIDYI